MKWIYIVEHPIDKQTASRTHVLEFCHALAKIDKVTLISQADPVTLSINGDYQCLQIKPIRLLPHNLGYILSTIKAFFYLCQLPKDAIPNFLYERAIGFSLGPLIYSRINHIPAILEINGNWEDEHRLAEEHLSFPAKQLVSFTNKLRDYSLVVACHLANDLIVVTPKLSSFLRQKHIGTKNNIIIAENGVNIERFTPQDITLCKNHLGLDPNVGYIGFVGSLAAWQGVDDLIIAYSLLPHDLTRNYHLIIVGDGPEYKRCVDICYQLKLGNSVIFTKSQPYSSIPMYLGACSVLVAPKKNLSSGYSPLKIYEYLASARPVIASRVEGLESIEQQKMGLLFSPGDVNDLAQKLQDIICIPENQKIEMGERGRHFIEANHSWDTVVKNIRESILSKSVSTNEDLPDR